MKLLIIGCGQCGGRIADEFARLSKVARVQRGFSVSSSVLAVNTDVADLSGLQHIESDALILVRDLGKWVLRAVTGLKHYGVQSQAKRLNTNQPQLRCGCVAVRK